MAILSHAKISTKLTIGFGCILATLVALSAVSIYEVSAINDRLTTINEVNSVKQRYAINFRGSVHDRAIFLRDVTLVESQKELDDAIATIRKLTDDYDASAVKMDAMFAERTDISQDERDILAGIKAVEKKTLPLIEQVISLQVSGDAAAAKELLMDKARPNFIEWLGIINKFIDLQEKYNQTIGAEVRGITQQFSYLMMGACGIALLVGAALAFWIIRTIAPLKRLTTVMLHLAEGDLATEVPEVRTRDEVGEITGAVQVLKTNAIAAKKLEAESKSAQEERLKRSEKVTQAVRLFEQKIESITNKLASSSSMMIDMANSLSGAVQQTTQLSSSVAAASQEASTNVQTVASAAEELSASIREIARNVADTADSTKACAQSAQISQSKLQDLQNAVEEIDSVILSINTVAEQTNLLALNATIEAARAGEAGKGFAVVASEVKSLAGETHKMTEEIAKKVEDIKSSARETITSVNDILGRITLVDEKTGSVASAVEQQNSSTAEISRNVQQAAHGTDEVSRNIEDVQKAASNSESSTRHLRTAFEELNQQASDLKSAVELFLSEVRMAG